MLAEVDDIEGMTESAAMAEACALDRFEEVWEKREMFILQMLMSYSHTSLERSSPRSWTFLHRIFSK